MKYLTRKENNNPNNVAKFKFHPVFEYCADIRTMYKHYVKWCDQYRVPAKDWETYKLVLETFNTIMVKKIIYEGFDAIFPFECGRIFIRKKSTTANKFLDYPEWQRTKKIVFHNNLHTNGYRIRIMWRRNRNMKNISFYSFRFSRDNNRLLASLLKNKKVDYFEC